MIKYYLFLLIKDFRSNYMLTGCQYHSDSLTRDEISKTIKHLNFLVSLWFPMWECGVVFLGRLTARYIYIVTFPFFYLPNFQNSILNIFGMQLYQCIDILGMIFVDQVIIWFCPDYFGFWRWNRLSDQYSYLSFVWNWCTPSPMEQGKGNPKVLLNPKSGS